MKLFSSLVAVLLAALSIPSPAVAQHEKLRGRDFVPGRSAAEMQRPLARRNEQKVNGVAGEQQFPREATPGQQAAEQRPIQDQGQSPGQARERLSPEERRQLRRDINAAGRDIYRRNRPE